MKVRELITALLECDMNSDVALKTTNTDINGYLHNYTLTGIDPAPVYTFESKVASIHLLFKNYDFDYDRKQYEKGYEEGYKAGYDIGCEHGAKYSEICGAELEDYNE